MASKAGLMRRSVGRRLQQLRKAAGLTQERLAERAGMDYKYLGSVERGERNITLDNLERIMRALEVEPYEPFLFSFTESKTPQEIDTQTVLHLINHTTPSIRSLLIQMVHSIFQWTQEAKKR